MRTFKQINEAGKCLICGKNDEGEVVLVPIDGTAEGHNEQAEQVHLKCIDLRYNKEVNALYQKLGGANES